jgi:polyferredoxin
MAKGRVKTGKWQLARWRIWVQLAFLLVWLDPLMVRMHNFCSPVFHCHSCPLSTFACPIGVLANFSALQVIPFVTIGILLVVGTVFGGMVCGWACPFGFLQDLAARVPTPKFELPSWTGYTRYVVLIVVVLAIPYFLGEDHPLFFCRLCPAGALEAAVPNVANLAITGQPIVWPSAVKMVILAIFLGTMFFTWRPWCTLFCPLGAIFGLLNRFSIVFLRFHPEQCSDCQLCRKMCHYGGKTPRRAGELSCIRCLECTRCDAVSLATIAGPFGEASKQSEPAGEDPK